MRSIERNCCIAIAIAFGQLPPFRVTDVMQAGAAGSTSAWLEPLPPTLTSLDCFYVTESLCCCCRLSGSFCVPRCSCDWYPLAFTIHDYSLFSYSEHASKFVSFSALGGTIALELSPIIFFFFCACLLCIFVPIGTKNWVRRNTGQ